MLTRIFLESRYSRINKLRVSAPGTQPRRAELGLNGITGYRSMLRCRLKHSVSVLRSLFTRPNSCMTRSSCLIYQKVFKGCKPDVLVTFQYVDVVTPIATFDRSLSWSSLRRDNGDCGNETFNCNDRFARLVCSRDRNLKVVSFQ